MVLIAMKRTLPHLLAILFFAQLCASSNAQDDNPASIEALRNSGAGLFHKGLGEVHEHENVRVVYFQGPTVDDEALRALQGLQSVAELHLHGTQITDAAFAHFAHLRELRSIYITRTWYGGDKDADGILLPTREDQLEITGSGFIHFYETNLQRLIISGTQINDDSLPGIVELESHLEDLQQVSIAGNEVTREGLIWLREQLPDSGVALPGSTNF